MTFIFAMEVAERDLFSSAAIVSAASVVSLFVVMSVIAGVPLVAVLSLASLPVAVMSGVARLFFGHCVHGFVLLRLIRMSWLPVRSVAILRPLLLIHFLNPSPLPTIRFAIFLHYFKELVDFLRLAPLQVFSARA